MDLRLSWLLRLGLPLIGTLVTACGDQDTTRLSDCALGDAGACAASPDSELRGLDRALATAVQAASGGLGNEAFLLPDTMDIDALPQDPNNPITEEKVALGQMLFHDTAFAVNGFSDDPGTWSCATCHHAAAGFKAGVAQGIAEGGLGFNGDRVLAVGFDADSTVDELLPDLQPIASPTALNSAYQEVMLWNGQFGNMIGGVVNAGLDPDILAAKDTPKQANDYQLGGLEIQAIAGTGVHRLGFEGHSLFSENATYRALWDAAYPDGSSDITRDAGKAIAAYERTLIANRAPFQRWLRGETDALNSAELRGGALFFGKAGCVDCHTGPALSSAPGASKDEMFFAIGFRDFDTDRADIHGKVDDATRRGRGGFTGETNDDFRFKVPQLYNLADTEVFGHGASFDSIRAVVQYKNHAIAQNRHAEDALDHRFFPLGLSDDEVADLTTFLSTALYDEELERYQPESVPGGACIVKLEDTRARDAHRCPTID